MASFSSTLLDEIYRSIDDKSEDFKSYDDKPPVKKQGGGVRTKMINKSVLEDQEAATFERASLIDKWMMEKDDIVTAFATRKPSKSLSEMENNKSLLDSDLLFFSSSSSSSDSSGALSSSSDTELFGSTKNATTKSKVSCFTTMRPKPIRTCVSAREKEKKPSSTLEGQQNHPQKNKMEDDLMKYRNRALKVYANLKKLKQPISPGARLSSFINSLFYNVNSKKSKNLDTNKVLQESKSPKTTLSSTCSSASSFSKSCLSKLSPRSREKMRDGLKRTVRFHPVSEIFYEDSRPCGHKSLYDQSDSYGTSVRKPPLPPSALEELKLCMKEKNRKQTDEYEEDGEDYDAMSDSSSDLFEIDHLSLFGNHRFCEELPVYETTNLVTNRSLASGLIRC